MSHPPPERVLRLLDSMPAAFFALDRSYRVTYVNRVAAVLAGKPAEEVVGGNIWEEFPLLADSEHREACRRAMKERVAVSTEGTLPGDRRIACFAYPTEDGLATYIRDVTEEHEARRRLAEAETRFRAIVENASEVVTLVDENADIRFVTPASERVLGYTPEEMQGRNAFEFIHPDDHPHAVENLRALVDDGDRSVSAEIRLRRKDGTWIWSESAGRNLLDDPVIRAIIATHREVTDRKRAEEALRESERWFRALIEGSADGVMLIDPETRITYLAPSVERMLGYAPEEVIGRNAAEFIHPDDIPRLRRARRELLDDPSRTPMAGVRVRQRDGSWRWIEGIGRNLLGEPAVKAIVINFRDVTERMEVEAALRRTDRERRALLSRIVGAHEEERARIALDIHDDTLQTLTAFGMRVGMLKNVLEDEEQRARLGDVESTLAKAMQRLRTLLFELRPPPLDEQGIETALELYLREQTHAAGLSYSLDAALEPEPPPETRVTLYRIAQEALSNVVRHASATRVDVRLRSRDRGVEAEIRDDGRGFDPATGAASQRPGHLGLSAMRERAEMAGGWIRVETAPGEGTTVRFWVPSPEAAAPAEGDEA